MHRILAVLLGGAAAFAAGDPPPIAFEPNQGQTHPQVQALARGAGYTLFLSSGDAVLTLKLPAAMRADALMRIRLLGARPAPQARFLEPLPGVSHYLSGNDRGNWRTGIPRYGRVSYHGVYEGIDLVYYGREGRVESDFVVSPGARPGSIRLAVDGARDVRLEGGDLVAETFAGQVRLRQPVVYQEAGESRRQVSGAWELHPGGAIGFAIGPHDARLPLVIDPVLDYSTYLGGNSGESIYGIAVDASGATYIAGETQSADFPAANPFQSARKSARDAFVAKLNPAGSALVYSTYLGGDADDRINAIAVDAVGNAYVAGRTASRNFPTASPLRANYGGGDGDAFAAKLNPSGSALLYSTYLGGASDDGANGIAVDSAGNAYLAGFTQSNDFPTQRPFQATRGAATCRESLLGFTWTWPCSDAFAAKLNPAGSALVFSTFLGGSRGSGNSAGSDTGNAIALDASGNVYLAGETNSSDFPVRGPAQTSLGGGTDAFVAKLSDAGSALALAYSTYLGGSASDYGRGIAVAASGAAVVAGYTTSPNFPTASPHQAVLGGGSDAFLTQLNAAGSGLVYSTYLGGKQDDQANAVAVDAAGNALLTGSTRSDDFPRLNAPQPLRAGSDDAFLVKAGPAGSLVLSTYFGGSGGDVGNAIALRGDAAAYLAGSAGSTDLPVTTGAVRTATGGGSSDGFVARFSDLAPAGPSATNLSSASLSGLALAPDSLVSAFGDRLALSTEAAALPWPPSLAGTAVKVTDSAGVERLAAISYASRDQVNYQVPPETAPGLADIAIVNAEGAVSRARVRIESVAPGLFSANGDARGVAAAHVLRVRADGSRTTGLAFRFDETLSRRVPVPIDLRTQTDDVILLLYGTGIRARSDLRNVKVTIGQEECEVLYAGPQGEFPGLDQVNVRLPRALLGKDIVSLTLTADGKASNVVTLEMGGRPRISGLTPRMVEVGASNADVVISGEYLTGVTRLQFDSAAGITVSELRVVSDTEVRAKVTITAEARVGDRPFRAVSPAGTSDRFNFIVRPRPGSNAPFIYNVTAGLTLVGLNLAGVSGSFDFEDADGDIRWTGALQTSARVRVSGPSCTATGSGAYLDFAGRNSGRVNYVVTWSPGGLSFGNFSASLVLIDAAGNQSAAYIWEPGGWWGC